jgi:crossover junction endodeoxyribonuclease RuvC
VRVLGVDCGTERTGYGIIDSDGRKHVLVDAGVIRLPRKTAMHLRLLEIANQLRRKIAEHRPDSVAIEEVFYALNVQTALKLSHVRGVALLAAAEAGLELGEYSPLEVKICVVGYGRAEKQQVQKMVASLLRLKKIIESEDASDALAVAICHATHASTLARIAKG